MSQHTSARQKRIFVLLLVASWLATAALVAEPVKGAYRGEVLPDAPAVTFTTEEVVQVTLPATTRFTRGLEIEVTIPRELLPYRSLLALFVYQNYVAPKGKEPGQGDKLSVEVLPPNARFYLLAPLVAKAGLRASVDTAVLKLTQLDKGFPLAVVVLPIGELPAEAQHLAFQLQLRTRPINSNLGALSVLTPTLGTEERKRLKLTANGVPQSADGLLLLEPGLYTLEASLPGYSGGPANVAVSQAKVTEVTLELPLESPSVVFEAPEGAQIVLDGKKLAWTPVTLYPVELGTHLVQVSIGNTLVSQAFEIPDGGKYRIRLNLQLLVEKQ